MARDASARVGHRRGLGWRTPLAVLRAAAQGPHRLSRRHLARRQRRSATRSTPSGERCASCGYVEGQNLEIHFRWAEGQPDRLPGLAAELVRLEPDVIVTMGPAPAFAAKRATTTVPVVATIVDTPVENGLIADFVRPGGNVTGISSLGSEVFAKRLQLLKELVPSTASRRGRS